MAIASPLETLEQELTSRVALLRRDLDGRIGEIAHRLDAYRVALEHELAREFALSHSFKAPRGEVLSPAQAAEALRAAVAALPELAKVVPAVPPPAPPQVKSEPSDKSEGSRAVGAPPAGARLIPDVLPALVRAIEDGGRIVVVGAFAGRTKSLPAPLDASTEWIDTARDGVHAVGNLPQRMKRGGITGVILCEQIIGHQHSDPVQDAARSSHVPLAFAGKGGNLGLSRALEALEVQLNERHDGR